MTPATPSRPARSFQQLAVFAWLLAATPLGAIAGEVVDFARDVQPILQQHCIECHGAEEQNGGLRFDTKAGAFAVGDSGSPAIVAGDSEQSGLLARVLSSDEFEQMPPSGERLTAAQISLLSSWIADGAPWPEQHEGVQDATDGTTHWSFQPLADPELPMVGDEAWPLNPIDRFIQARREAADLQVAEDAEPIALLRRVAYDLTGLPPTPDEVTAFVAASQRDSRSAWVAEIDRLLASPRYGERWGRHWMDWVRYADTAGDNSDFPIPQAYLYRNYIIDSFNADLPYDRFLTEQIAGDLLPACNQAERNRQTIATGYLAMARRFGSLVERYPWHLTIEDTIDNVGRTMMGLTISCARCHDHKFDPISTRDYYGLYGIFASTQYPFPGIELFQVQHHLVPLIPAAEAAEKLKPYRTKTDELEKELDRLLTACQQQALQNAAVESELTVDQQRKAKGQLDAMLGRARRAGEKLAAHLKEIPVIPAAYAVQDDQPVDARVQIKGEPTRLGAEVPRRFPEVLGGHRLPEDVAASGSGRLQLARWIASPENPLTARVIVNRIWQRHFGTGLVASASDFGLRGEEPTHPQLLDWLAGELIRSGWSIKHLHRLILSSRTYQLSSEDLKENLASDPGNRYHWKFSRQRLDAESIRDTLLLISGSLDSTPQRQPHPFPPAKDWGYTQHHPFKDDYPSNKRSVYLMTKRLTAKPYFQTFDGPDRNVCTTDRDQSVTPLQALYFVNDEFLHERADRFASLTRQRASDDEQRLEFAFATILCRPPTAEESTILLEHLGKFREKVAGKNDADQQAWASLVRSLLRLNEFLYLD